MNILFLVPYPLNEAPSQRFRFEQYFEILVFSGHSYRVQSFLNSNNWQLFFKSGKFFFKIAALLHGFIRRLTILFTLHRYDYVFIHREASPVGPPFIEWIIAKIFKKKIIYDFDDAIWLTDRKSEPFWMKLIKWRVKVRLICTWSHKISCGNQFLSAYAGQFNTMVILNPTTIDTERLHNPALYKRKQSDKITIGWTGSHSTLKYLAAIENVLADLLKACPELQLLVIADNKPALKIPFNFKHWNVRTEIEDLLQCDIGIMPLPDNDWSRGKCGFKALQYMALEIPAIASPVGVNTRIITHGYDGFLASLALEWETFIKQLINDPKLRQQIGKRGRETIVDQYSVRSNTDNFLSLFASS